MKIDNLDITELSYLDALNILKRDLKSDTSMPAVFRSCGHCLFRLCFSFRKRM